MNLLYFAVFDQFEAIFISKHQIGQLKVSLLQLTNLVIILIFRQLSLFGQKSREMRGDNIRQTQDLPRFLIGPTILMEIFT